ncbi:helix-turn-helix domain-containing protein [Microbacterium marinum]|uniref:helix-turn-helix domain-containing protein n=1 Tax=Microbacterium marinum TaxID=421115 RepID=UPI00161FD1C4
MTRSPRTPATWEQYARELGHRLQRLRHEAELSQDAVAYRANLSRYTYQEFEKGESRPGTPANPSVRSLLAIAQALDTDLAAILPQWTPDLTTH